MQTIWANRAILAHAERAEAARAELTAAHTAWRSSRSASDEARWRIAASAFDAVLRDGIGTELEACLRDGLDDPRRRAFAFAFIAAAPRFFRSGYILDALLHKAKRLRLSGEERRTLSGYLVSRLGTGPRRHFRRALRHAAQIDSPALRAQIHARLAGEDAEARTRAAIALDAFGRQAARPERARADDAAAPPPGSGARR